MAKKSVSWKKYLIEIDEKGSVKVSKAGTACDNTKAALREIAEDAGKPEEKDKEGPGRKEEQQAVWPSGGAGPGAARRDYK